MTRVLVTAAGSSPGLDILRSLRRDPGLTLVAGDADPIGLAFAARLADESLLLPRADRQPEEFVAALETNRAAVDALFLSIDKEIEVVARRARPLSVPAPLARPEVLRVMLDKGATAAAAAPLGIVPRTYVIASPAALAAALDREGGKAWLRPASGTSGQGSLPVGSAEEGAGWMALWRARGYAGEWMAQELLPGRNFNWTGIYQRGELVAAAAMERISYWLGQLVPSGITGQVRQAVTVVDRRLDAVGDLAARALEPLPDGIFSVDLRENAAGEPRLNEVNPRPAGRPWLYACAGVNIPLAALRSRLGLPLADAVAPGGLRAGIRLFRQLDSEPVVVDDAGFDARGID